jgi:hypothetical protein
MKLLLENWRKYLNEATDLLQSKNGNVVIFADWAKEHIEGAHKEPGLGSIFADFDLSQIGSALSQIDIDGEGGVFSLRAPGVGYDLVLPMAEAIKLPDAKKITVQKEERGAPVEVIGIQTSAPLEAFKTDQLSIVARPTTDLQYVPDDVKQQVAPAVEAGRVYSLLSAWPGRGDVPPASQWGDKWAVIIPQGT